MESLLARSWGLVVTRGVIAVLFGFMALVWPGLTVLALVLLFGLYAIVDGLAALVAGIGGGRQEGRGLLITMGAVGVVAGVLAFLWPGATAVVLLVLIALWALVTGAGYLLAAWRMRGQVSMDWLLGLNGVLLVGLGVIMLTRPTTGAVTLAWLIGLLALAWGIATIAIGLRLRGSTRSAGPAHTPRVV